MKKLLIIVFICFLTFFNAKAHLYQINICYQISTPFYNLCIGDTLRFVSDSTQSYCYGTILGYVYNCNTHNYDNFVVVTTPTDYHSYDHILADGDSCYNYQGISNCCILVFNCANDISEKPISTFKIIGSTFPSPADNYVTINYPFHEFSEGILNITDSKGVFIKSCSLHCDQDKIIISLNELNDGIYFYHIIIDKLLVISNKFIVIKQK
jgi:hypothetical protein